MKGRAQLLLLVVAASLPAVLVAQSHASSTGWTTKRYYSHQTSHYFADIGTKGGSPDDIYVSQQTLTDTSGKTVGIVNGYGVNLHKPYVFFHYTGVVGKGSITLEGAVNLKHTEQVYGILGGTGAYTGARGTVTISDAGKHGSLVVIRYHD
jgi:hypothetical protein